MEQGLADRVIDCLSLAEGVDIADYGLRGLKDTEGVTDNTARVQCDEAGQYPAVDVVEQERNR
jgi:hypothetical protein